MTAKTLAELAGGRLDAGDPDVAVTGVSIDTRRLEPGNLFVALRGDRADGHSYLSQAFVAGASALLVREDAAVPSGIAVVRIADPASALASLAAGVRARLTARVVAITGSSGKTMTKELTAAVVRTRFRTTASEASFNNEIGVPLTILAADAETEVLVAEVGSRGVGHIASLLPVLQPDIGVVLNVGAAHVGMFGSIETVARSKGELVEGLPAGGTAVLNADDPRVEAMASRTRASVLRFGTGSGGDVRAEGIALDGDGRASFTLVTPAGATRVLLRIPGEHVVSDALAAAAAGTALGVDAAVVAEALSEARGPAWRMEVVRAPGGFLIVNDAYNANPASTAAALKTLAAMARGRRTWAVLGHMAELGDAEVAEHDRIGRLTVRLGVDRLVAVGAATTPLHEAARLEGMTAEEAILVADATEAVALLRSEVRAGDVVLVKASRAAGLERVALALAEEAGA